MLVVLQQQHRQRLPGPQLCQLGGQQVPLCLQLGLRAEAALELLLHLLQPLPLAQQVHPGDRMGRSDPAAAPCPPPTASHRSPGLRPCSSPRISACSSCTRCSLLLTASMAAASSSSTDVRLQETPVALSCSAGSSSPCLQPGPAHECWTLSMVSSFSCSSAGARLSVSSSKLSSNDTTGGTSEPYLQAASMALLPTCPVLGTSAHAWQRLQQCSCTCDSG